jgi:predicted amino acid dehydrogenase
MSISLPSRGAFSNEPSDSSAARCPRCGLVLSVRAAWLAPRHCPRCLARRVAVELERSGPRSSRARNRPGEQG